MFEACKGWEDEAISVINACNTAVTDDGERVILRSDFRSFMDAEEDFEYDNYEDLFEEIESNDY